MPGNELVQALGRGLDLLKLLAESNGVMKLADIAAATGLKRPTAHNLLRTLSSRGFVVSEDGVFTLGPALFQLAAAATGGELLKRAETAVKRLAALLPNGIVSFCEPVGDELLVRFHLFPDKMLMQRNSRFFSPYDSASGLAFLAHADPETRQRVQLRHPFESEGRPAWRNEDELEAFLREVRAKGHVLPPANLYAKFRVSALPVISDAGRFLGALGVAWHVVPGCPEDMADKAVAAMRQVAAECFQTKEA